MDQIHTYIEISAVLFIVVMLFLLVVAWFESWSFKNKYSEETLSKLIMEFEDDE